MPLPLLMVLGGLTALLVVYGTLRFVVTPLSSALKLSSLNQCLFLMFIVFLALRAALPLFSQRIPASLTVPSILWGLIWLALLITDRLKLYRAEVIGLAACGIWLLAEIPLGILHHGINWHTAFSVFTTLFCLVVFRIFLGHPFEVLRRTARMRKRKV